MAKQPPQFDVLVLGDHPAAYFTAVLLRHASLKVAHCLIPGETFPDRLVQIHPAFFELDASLAPLRQSLDLSPVFGLQFLADDPATHAEYLSDDAVAYVGRFAQVHDGMKKLAEAAGVTFYRPRAIGFSSVDESGVIVRLDDATLHPKLLILAGDLPREHRPTLGLPGGWDAGVLRRYTYAKLKGAKWAGKGEELPVPQPGSAKPAPGRAASGNGASGKGTSGKGVGGKGFGAAPAARSSHDKAMIPMSLDLNGRLNWAWLLSDGACYQPAVEQPLADVDATPPAAALRHWMDVLRSHGRLSPDAGKIDARTFESLDLPLAGALSREGVGSRTLLVGPAGGFYTASGEDIYPNCWSAVFAADVARKALKEKHLQDALAPFRQEWGATLGDYLRGPQQNLRFLLPLIYRNKVMTARVAEAILTGQSVVR